MVKELAVSKLTKKFKVTGLAPGLDYDVTVTSLSAFEGLRAESEPSNDIVTTLPESPKNVRLDNATLNSLSVRWDSILPNAGQRLKYIVKIENPDIK